MRQHQNLQMWRRSDVTEQVDSFGSRFHPSQVWRDQEMRTSMLVIAWSEGGTAVMVFSYKVNYPLIFLKIFIADGITTSNTHIPENVTVNL